MIKKKSKNEKKWGKEINVKLRKMIFGENNKGCKEGASSGADDASSQFHRMDLLGNSALNIRGLTLTRGR